MSDITINEMTDLLKWTSIALMILALLLVLVKIAQMILRRMVRKQMAATDLDLVGQRALVTQVVRPHRPGKIRFRTTGGDRVAEAASDQVIRSGKTVLITAVRQGRFRVVPDVGNLAAEPNENAGKAERSIRPSHIELADFDEETEHAGHATLAAHIKLTEQAARAESAGPDEGNDG